MTEDRLAGLYRQFAPLIYRRCLGILANEDEAREAVQDVFLLLIRKQTSFRGESEVMTWVYRITTNHCLNRLRSRKTRSRVFDSLEQRSLQDPGTEPARDIERRDLVLRLLERFDDRRVQIVIHRFYDEMTQVEIAETMGISERAVRKSLQRFFEQARDHLAHWKLTIGEEI